jgi:predicted AlkP superfamily phosphohydrolase/phosphomutase
MTLSSTWKRHPWKTFALYLTVFLVVFQAACTPGQQIRSGSTLPHPVDNIPPSSTATITLPTYTPTPSTSLPSQIPSPTASISPPTETASPRMYPSATPEKPGAHPIIVVSFDGAPAGQVYRMMEQGILPAFSALASQGVWAESMTSTDPSLTAPAHASLITGAFPAKTGIVSNLYHNPNDSFYWYRSGFEQPLDQVDPIWVTASRAGLTTASLFVAGGSPFLPGQTADYTIAYGVRDAYSDLEKLKLVPVRQAWEGQAPTSFSPPLEASWIIEKVSKVYITALDSLDDDIALYDSFVLNTQRVFTPNSLTIQPGEWGALILDSAKGAGAHFLIQNVLPARNQLRIEIYHTGVNHNTATPRPLLEGLNQKFGFFPAGPDSYALDHGWITPAQFLEMLQRSTTWMTDVTLWVYQTYQPDLLFTWLDAFDAAGHTALPADAPTSLQGVDPTLYQQAARAADTALASLLGQISLEETNLVVLSDHGMAPVHTTVNLNTLLQDAGLLVLDQKDYVVVEKSQAIAFASGGSANVYINREGWEQDGIVPETEYVEVLQKIQDLLAGLVDPKNGQPVIRRTVVREDLISLHLKHLHSGDLFIQANPGYNLDSHRGWDNIFSNTGYAGQHGYDCTLPEMAAIFIAAGPGIPAADQVIPPLQIVDVAPSLLLLSGLPLDPEMDGSPIPLLIP